MPTILVTNDDGIHAPSLLYLKEALSVLGDIMVLAPERNWSAAGHAKTMHKPLRLHEVALADGSLGHSTNGGPSDCVALAALAATGRIPDLVVSGINMGYNLGSDITYSGTVAAAMEAVLHHIPAMAVSSCPAPGAFLDAAALGKTAAAIAADLAQRVWERGLPAFTLLNVNVPCLPRDEIRGVRFCRLGHRIYQPQLVSRHDPRGLPYFWFGGAAPDGVAEEESDIGAIKSGYVSITPVSLDMTDYEFMPELMTWNVRFQV